MDWSKILDKVIDAVVTFATTWGIRVVGVLVALFVAWILAGWARRAILRTLEKRSFDATLTKFFANLVKWAILAGAVIGCLGVFGIQTASFAAVIGAMGLAVGLAFQGTLSNFAAGVMLLVFRPFKVGDVVNTAGFIGTVNEVELFTTDLTTFDNRRIIVPNSSIFGSVIENLTHNETRRVDVPVGVDYAADVDETRKVLEAMIPSIPGVLEEPAPQIFLKELGASSVDWVVRVWCKTDDFWDVYQATIRASKMALDEASLGIPFPQMDIHLDDAALAAFSGKRPSPIGSPIGK
jgi:small conductance mechanosensitive channel